MRIIGLTAACLLLASCDNGAAAGGHAGAGGERAVTSAAPEDSTGYRMFRDWYVSCDNVGTCYAFGHATDDGSGWVRVRMPAGPEGRPSVVISLWPEGELTPPLSATIDGRSFAAPISLRSASEDIAPVGTVDPAEASAIVGAIAQGQVMTVSAGADTVTISLSGAAASLLWIDERQGRLGTTTALMRKGSAPASRVPAAPPTPRVEPAPGVAQSPYGDQEGQTLPASLEALPSVIECRAETAFNPDLQTVISSARLDANTVLWSVPCGAGAYNFATAYFTTDPAGANPRRVLFPRASGDPDDTLVNASYDPATRVIDAFNKGRGIGDCGLSDSWTWTTRGFAQKASSEMQGCWAVPLEYWPTTWVSQ